MQIEIARRLQRDSVKKLLPFLSLAGLSIFVAVSIVHYPLTVITLLLGLPALFLLINEKTRFIGLLTIFALAPFMGIVKAFTGVRYAPFILDIALLLLVTFCILKEVILNRLRLSSLGMMIALLIILAAVQMLNPNIPGLLTGLEGFRSSYQAIGFFGCILLMQSKKQIKQVVFVLSFSSLLVAIYGVKQFFYPSSIDLNIIAMTTASPVTYTTLEQLRAFSTMSGPFHLGIYMVMVILMMLSLLQEKGRRLILLLMITIFLTVLLLTVTRGNWIGLFGAMAFYNFLLVLEKKVRLAFRTSVLVGGLIVGIALFVQSRPYLPAVTDYLTSLDTITETPHFKGRIAGWGSTAIPAILSNPFIGYGTGSALDAFSHRSIHFTQFTSHSLYLKYAVEMGIGGLLLFLLILFSSMKQGIKTYFQLKDIYLKLIAGWILSFIVAVSISGLSAPMLDAYPVNLYFWFLLGLLPKLKDIETSEGLSLKAE